MCDQFFPRGKWKACSMVDDMKRVRNLKKVKKPTHSTFFKQFEENCCVYTLHVAELPLFTWDVDNPNMQNIVEIYLAILCYYMLYEYHKSEEISNVSLTSGVRKRDKRRQKFLRHLEFLKKHWIHNTQNTGVAGSFIASVSLLPSTVLEHDKTFRSYLTNYLNHRNIPESILSDRDQIDFDFYDDLFEEYFTGRPTHNLVFKWGKDPAYNGRLITTHTRSECDACVGFVCFRESISNYSRPEMQGIVSCPFYRAAFSNQEYVLGSANTILDYMNERRKGEQIRVSPIQQNRDWINRLSEVDFIVDHDGNRIMGGRRKRKKHSGLKSICDSDSDSD